MDVNFDKRVVIGSSGGFVESEMSLLFNRKGVLNQEKDTKDKVTYCDGGR